MPSFDITIRGDKYLLRGLRQTVRNIRDLREFFKRVYDGSFVPSMAQVFSREGPGWKPLNPQYLAAKVAAGYRPEIGRRTDAMRKTLATRSRTPGTIRRIAKQEATFGTSLEYAGYFDAERDLLTSTAHEVAGYIEQNLPGYLLGPVNYKGVREIR